MCDQDRLNMNQLFLLFREGILFSPISNTLWLFFSGWEGSRWNDLWKSSDLAILWSRSNDQSLFFWYRHSIHKHNMIIYLIWWHFFYSRSMSMILVTLFLSLKVHRNLWNQIRIKKMFEKIENPNFMKPRQLPREVPAQRCLTPTDGRSGLQQACVGTG